MERIMSVIKVQDIAYVRFAVPDLSVMQSFLEDFGLSKTPFNGPNLYMKGLGDAPFLYACEQGDAAFKAVGFKAKNIEDLSHLAVAHNVAVEPHDAPGGGMIVRLTDPDGNAVEVVADQLGSASTSIPPRAVNNAWEKPRIRKSVRLENGPAEILRLGHIVLEVADFATSERWYKDNFGFLTSEQIEPVPGVALGAFMRCDLGETPTDHHTIVVAQGMNGARFNHAAFEVTDINEVMRGHQHLKNAGRDAAWGVGRHILGSQIFDYWRDPHGFEMEHWTDGDMYTADMAPNVVGLAELMGVQWGNPNRNEAPAEGAAA
jgi:catechol 2,3-dioxygenase-like lactoylglutathione lyase family enzyme